jgi:hypothetical protein
MRGSQNSFRGLFFISDFTKKKCKQTSPGVAVMFTLAGGRNSKAALGTDQRPDSQARYNNEAPGLLPEFSAPWAALATARFKVFDSYDQPSVEATKGALKST